MFVSLLTPRGEHISVNVNKVLFFAETKKGSSIVLDDGSVIELTDSYKDLVDRFVIYNRQ